MKFFSPLVPVISAALLAALFALPAPAQDKAPPAAPAATPAATPAAPAAAPKHTCAKPTPLTKGSKNPEIEKFNKDIAVYRSCLEAYAVDMRRAADAHINAANTSVEEYNAFIAEMREVTKKDAPAK